MSVGDGYDAIKQLEKHVLPSQSSWSFTTYIVHIIAYGTFGGMFQKKIRFIQNIIGQVV